MRESCAWTWILLVFKDLKMIKSLDARLDGFNFYYSNNFVFSSLFSLSHLIITSQLASTHLISSHLGGTHIQGRRHAGGGRGDPLKVSKREKLAKQGTFSCIGVIAFLSSLTRKYILWEGSIGVDPQLHQGGGVLSSGPPLEVAFYLASP